jgi:hypothetical protein
MVGTRLCRFDGDEPPEPLAVLRFHDQVSDSLGDRVEHNPAHSPAHAVAASSLDADGEPVTHDANPTPQPPISRCCI